MGFCSSRCVVMGDNKNELLGGEGGDDDDPLSGVQMHMVDTFPEKYIEVSKKVDERVSSSNVTDRE